MCVRLSRFKKEDDQSAEDHLSLLEFVLQLYGKLSNKVVAIVANNCVIKKCVADIKGTKVSEYASHRYNLAYKEVVNSHQEFIGRAKKIISKLCFSGCRAKLRLSTLQALIKSVETRWSSVRAMITSYAKMRELL